MKIILTGATGFIGSAVLKRLLAVPQVSAVFALSRRELEISDPKLQTILVKDFTKYDEDVLTRLTSAQACIWCLGTPKDGHDIHVGYPLAAARAFSAALFQHLPEKSPFRFILTSGAAVERDQEKSLWIMGAMRKMRGEGESQIIALEKEYPDQWASFIARPPFVGTTTSSKLRATIFEYVGLHIPPEELAAAMVDVAMNGSKMQTLDTAELRRIGRKALGMASQ